VEKLCDATAFMPRQPVSKAGGKPYPDAARRYHHAARWEIYDPRRHSPRIIEMSELLFDFHAVHPSTWAYLASLLAIALFFKFSRIWSLRNVDLLLIIALAPGLLMVNYGREPRQADSATQATGNRADDAKKSGKPGSDARTPLAPAKDKGDDIQRSAPIPPPPRELATDEPSSRVNGHAVPAATKSPGDTPAPVAMVKRSPGMELAGFIWLFSAGGLLLLRLLLDPTMVRRPLLEPNLSAGGLIFLGCSVLVFLIANVAVGIVSPDELVGPRGAEQLMSRAEPGDTSPGPNDGGPGLSLLYLLPRVTTVVFVDRDEELPHEKRIDLMRELAAKMVSIAAQLAIVAGIIVIGYWHFDNIKTGVGVAALYLLLPYSSLMSGHAEHVVPGALLVWGVAFYRRPIVAGILLGLAMGISYYPLFLLPLWISFYWERGVVRFLCGVVGILLVLTTVLYFTSADWTTFGTQMQQMLGFWWPKSEGLKGVWDKDFGWDPVYRIPILTAFVALATSLALWPTPKNLGTLMSCTAAVMLGTQFWHGFGGGLYGAWYLPLGLLTIFRPNLEDRVALAVLGEGWFPRRREPLPTIDQDA